MGCCSSSEDTEETKGLLENNTIQFDPAPYSSPSGARSLPPVSTLVGQQGTSVFRPVLIQSHSTTTFSVISDTEQQLLDHIVANTEKDFIDISRHVSQHEPIDDETVKEKLQVYRELLGNGVRTSSRFLAQELFVMPDTVDDVIPTTLQFKSQKYKTKPTGQILNTDVDFMLSVSASLCGSFSSMKVANMGPLLVSFDV